MPQSHRRPALSDTAAVGSTGKRWPALPQASGRGGHTLCETRAMAAGVPIELSLRCADLGLSVRFYRELLGLPLHLADAHEGDEQPHYEAFWGEPGQPGFFMLILWQANPGVNTVNAYLG